MKSRLKTVQCIKKKVYKAPDSCNQDWSNRNYTSAHTERLPIFFWTESRQIWVSTDSILG